MNHPHTPARAATLAIALTTLLLAAGCSFPGVYHTGRPVGGAQPATLPNRPDVTVYTYAAPQNAPVSTPAPAPATVSAPAPSPVVSYASTAPLPPVATPPPPVVAAPAPVVAATVNTPPPSRPLPPPPAAPTTAAPAPDMPISALASALNAPPARSAQPAAVAVSAAVAPAAPAAPAAPSLSLQDTVWQLATLDNIPVHAPAPVTILMLDTAKKSLLGMSGDMRFRAHFETDANNLRFTQIATNRQNADLNPFESALLDMLSKTSAWRIANHTLSLLDQNNGALATFGVAGK